MQRIASALAVLLLLGLASGLSAPAVHAQSPSAAFDSTHFQELDYRMVGPTRGGRVTAVEGHPAHPHTFYMGSTGGGVWKTTDYGDTWHNLSDGYFQSPSIGDIDVAASDTSVIYVGTGSDGIRSNVLMGRGMYKSTDAGESWDFIGLREAGQIGAVRAHPTNPDRVYVAALGHPFGPNEQRGVFRSTDGGDTWTNVLYASDSTGAIDLELNPANPDEIYAAMWRGERKPWTIISGAAEENGIYKSTDGGDTWRPLTDGLPEGLTGKINIAVTPADPDRLYALVEAPEPEEGLYRSDDRGETWTLVNGQNESLMHRPFYFTTITAHPTDPDVVYVGNVRNYKSTDGGETFERVPVTHVDVHSLWINPEDPDLMIQGNDGGATVSLDGGRTWSTQHNQPTAELYQVNVDGQFPYWLYAGQQDNSTIMVPSLPPAESAPAGPEGWWHAIGGCETGPVVPKPDDPTIVYANCKGRFGRYSRATGQEKNYYVGAQYMYGRNPAELKYRFQRVSPIEVSPHDPGVVYHGSQYVHRTTDEGVTWTTISPDLTAFKPAYQVTSGRPITRDITGEEHYSTLYEIEVSPHDPQVIWTGANDGPVHVTRDGGTTWTDVTPPDLPPNGRIDGIDISPHDPATVYIAAQRRLLDDYHPYIYRSTDYGATWTLLTPGDNGLPDDHPTRTVREDPDREGLLYAGTEYGVFVSFDDGQRWQSLRLDMPKVPITDLRVHQQDLVLSTMGRGFWVLDNLTPLHQLSDDIAAAEQHLFQPKTAYRMRYWGGQRGPSGPEYRAPGAMIDYSFAEAPTEEVTLEILDGTGQTIRVFSSLAESDTAATEAVTRMTMPGPVEEAVAPLPAEAGHNRFTWNLRYPGTWSPSGRSGRGPLAVPGQYRVRLSVGDWSETRPLRLRMDPRIEADSVTVADMEEQLQLNLSIRDAMSTARRTAVAIDSTRDRLTTAAESGAIDAAEAEALQSDLDALHSELVTSDAGSYMPPMLIDQFGYLYSMTASADQRLGSDAFTRFETLRTRLDDLMDQWSRLQQRLPVATRIGD